MALKKLPNSLSDEELLSELSVAKDKKQEPVKEILEYKNDLLRFISFYNITPGNNRVRKSHLYNLYHKWSKSPVPRESFTLELGKYLLSTVCRGQMYFLINTKAVDISVAIYKLVKDTTEDKSKSPRWKAHFEKFLSEGSISPGNHFIESSILYFLYDRWLYNKSGRPTTRVSAEQFTRLCFIYFKNKYIGPSKTMAFGIDKEKLYETYGAQTIESITNGYKEKQRKRKENKKRKYRAPSTRTFS